MSDPNDIGLWGVPLAILAGTIRVSTPFMLVSIGESITEKSGRINLGLEGTLIFGAMAAYAVSYLTNSPWMGVFAAGICGMLFGLLHGFLCSLKRVNDIAIGISLMLLGTGLAFFFGKPYVQPTAPNLPSIPFGNWSSYPQVQSALEINVLFIAGIVIAFFFYWALRSTRWGMMLRTVGDSESAARALGFPVLTVRIMATALGGFLAGVAGSYLSLVYPGSWNESLSSGQGVMAVALVIFARWSPVKCVWAAMIFGGAGALGPALQSIGVTGGYYLFNAAPYVLTLALMIATNSNKQTLAGAPSELSLTR
jgi:general nucleoside transport system permease protein